MNQEEFRRQLTAITPDVPQHFSRHVDGVLEAIVRQEKQPCREAADAALRQSGRIGRRALILALAALLLLGTVALAAAHWGIFDKLSFMLGQQPVSNDALLQKIMHQETINGVDVTVYEAGYDGRTLFLQYGYRLPAEAVPEDGDTVSMLKALDSCGVGWWIDHFWINGQCIDMPTNSGGFESFDEASREILRTEYWRLDNLDVGMSGQVQIALPIGQRQPLADYRYAEHPERYDENGQLRQPEQGMVCFRFDASDAMERVTVLHPELPTVTDEVTVWASEVAFTPLMTYITLTLEGNPDALAAYKAVNGEGYVDDSGRLLYPFTSQDVHHDYITSLDLVDGQGRRVFPEHPGGFNGVGDTWAEFLYPCIPADRMPETLWLAPLLGDTGDMTQAIRIR